MHGPQDRLAINTQRVLPVIGAAGFATALVARAVDPVVLPIAESLAVSPKSVALLSTAFALPFALIPPIFGPIGDMLGKVRLIAICLVLLTATGVISAFAPNFQVLLGARIVAGVAAGGVFPIALALVGDLVRLEERQVAIGRHVGVVMMGNLLGAIAAGVIADVFGWRGVFGVLAAFGMIAFVMLLWRTRSVALPPPAPFDLKSVPTSYRTILRNPRAKVCYATVFIEGAAVMGIFPFVALLLLGAGESRASIAGLVIAGFGVGSVSYSVLARRMLNLFPPLRLVVAGGVIAGLALGAVATTPPWPVQVGLFAAVGFGFYMLHNYIQLTVTELNPNARGAAMSLHATSFFLGQASGPVLYGLGIASIGASASIVIGAVAMLLVGLFASRLLRH